MAKKPKLTQAYRKRRQFAASAVRSYNAAVTRIENSLARAMLHHVVRWMS